MSLSIKTSVPARFRASEAGYSLMEVLIAVAIIAALTAIVAPRLFERLETSRKTAALSQISMIKTGLDVLRLDLGRYPTDEEGLSLLVADARTSVSGWNGPYIDSSAVPIDPWGNAYQYSANPDPLIQGRVYSYGADGASGGSGINADFPGD